MNDVVDDVVRYRHVRAAIGYVDAIVRDVADDVVRNDERALRPLHDDASVGVIESVGLHQDGGAAAAGADSDARALHLRQAVAGYRDARGRVDMDAIEMDIGRHVARYHQVGRGGNDDAVASHRADRVAGGVANAVVGDGDGASDARHADSIAANDVAGQHTADAVVAHHQGAADAGDRNARTGIVDGVGVDQHTAVDRTAVEFDAVGAAVGSNAVAAYRDAARDLGLVLDRRLIGADDDVVAHKQIAAKEARYQHPAV